MSLFNYFKKVPKSNSSTQNSSAIAIVHTPMPETETETERILGANNETIISTSNLMDLGFTTTKSVSTSADSCSACCTSATACASEEQFVTDLGSKFDGPKQPILETSKYSDWRSPTKI